MAIAVLTLMKYKLAPLGFPSYEGPPLDFGQTPHEAFVSSPNMDYIPDFPSTNSTYVRKNGRFYMHDYTLWPQWYFEATKHLPFVLRRPPAESLAAHKLRLIWYNLKDTDFIREKGTIADMWRTHPDLVKGFKQLRVNLSNKINALLLRLSNLPDDFCDFCYAQHGMLITSIALDCAPQSRFMTLLTFTAFQCYYLEALAFYNFYDKWNIHLASASERQPVDATIMGAVTCHLHIAQLFCQAGVPVWLFRVPYQLTPSMKVASMVSPVSEFDGLDNDVYPNSVCIMKSAPSSVRNKASQTIRVTTVSIGPSAYDSCPGDSVPVSTPCVLLSIASSCISLIYCLGSFCFNAWTLDKSWSFHTHPSSYERAPPSQLREVQGGAI